MSRWSFFQSQSIRQHLMYLVMVILAVFGSLSVAFLLWGLRHEMQETLDANLVVYANHLSALSQDRQLTGVLHTRLHSEEGYENSMAIQIWNAQGELVLRSERIPEQIVALGQEGFSDVQLSGEDWRSYASRNAHTGYWIIVARSRTLSNHMINEILISWLIPMLAGFLILLLLLWYFIRESLRPLNDLSQNIAERSPERLEPVSLKGAPLEVRPMIVSLNRLMSSLEDSLNKERDFTANAAHELRTPLAIIDTLVQTALKAPSPSILHKIKNAVNGAKVQIEQLLTLARLDANMHLTQPQRIDVYEVAQKVCTDLLNIYHEQGTIDLKLYGHPHAWIQSEANMIYILLKNIIENAIKYTPRDGKICVYIDNEPHVRVTIIDTGVGISAEHLKSITDRFYRVTHQDNGFGLGMSIVQRICQLNDAQLVIENRALSEHDTQGLRVAVTFRTHIQ
ncbi:two-component sensor histidine kinase [Formosimonas limnophila]|uniref:histidine kinase n=1 Tax=Formosimonas limnophila TaxID=1384487 RepID=A0A8J3CH42_9BURK|nr:ATP-binding protein [Formosimonas limnophila]GHA70685.1 two-component sensor histidine kinase [Formosimonas limnophila]